ncbi:MAG: hypothetical protein ACFE8U_09510 [Candidatus Hermodarchaeota archaeon]
MIFSVLLAVPATCNLNAFASSSSLVIQQASDEKYYFILQLVRSKEATTSTKSVGNRLIFTLEVMVLVSMAFFFSKRRK